MCCVCVRVCVCGGELLLSEPRWTNSRDNGRKWKNFGGCPLSERSRCSFCAQTVKMRLMRIQDVFQDAFDERETEQKVCCVGGDVGLLR